MPPCLHATGPGQTEDPGQQTEDHSLCALINFCIVACSTVHPLLLVWHIDSALTSAVSPSALQHAHVGLHTPNLFAESIQISVCVDS